MLIGIPGLLHADLLHVLASMGHGDELVIADGNFPAARLAQRLIRVGEASTTLVAEAVLKLMPLDEFVEAPLALMRPRDVDRATAATADLLARLGDAAPGAVIEQVDRQAFYERAAAAFAVVATTDLRPYANVLMKKGVVVGAAHAG
jgi:L-fucose mutarotase